MMALSGHTMQPTSDHSALLPAAPDLIPIIRIQNRRLLAAVFPVRTPGIVAKSRYFESV